MRLSSESSNCRIDWRPSPWLCLALLCLGALAATSLWLSALPVLAKLPLALLAIGYGFQLARHEACKECLALDWQADSGAMTMRFADRSRPLKAVNVRVHGPLAGVTGRSSDDRRQRLLWWPDTLPTAARRTLRLASSQRMGESSCALATLSG